MKRLAITLFKLTVSVAIIAYLVRGAWGDDTFAQLAQRPKHWGMLAAALGACLLGVILTFFRWQMLVRALGMPFSAADALRLGFLGYVLNFVSPGSVGGDLFKAVFLTREHPGRRAAAFATILADRVMGLYGLVLVAAAAILMFGQLHAPNTAIRDLCWGVLACAILGAVGIAAMFWPGASQGWGARKLRALPKVGPMFDGLLAAMDRYRTQPRVLVVGLGSSVVTHIIFTLCIYLVARGMPSTVPSLADHFIIAPLAMLAGAIPLAFGGLGAFEGALDLLYVYVPTDVHVPGSEGLIVAFGYRIITIVIALVGVVYYFAQRREISQVMNQVHDLEAEPADERMMMAAGQ